MLWTRVASGVVLGPIFLLIVYLGSPWFSALIAFVGAMAAFEFARMTGILPTGQRWSWPALIMVAGPPVAIIAYEVHGVEAGSGALIAAFAVVLLARVQSAVGGIFSARMALIYAGVPALALIHAMALGGSATIFWLITIVWGTDIGAYAAGRLIGGPKLAPSVSPNKTWSGAAGGLISAILGGSAVLWGFGLPATLSMAGMAAVLSVVSQLGDLYESALKRRYQIKDSGAIIPGHGGIMDRFDGLWMAAPVLALICAVLGGGVREW